MKNSLNKIKFSYQYFNFWGGTHPNISFNSKKKKNVNIMTK